MMNLEKLKPHLPWITLVLLTLIVGLLHPNFLRPENLIQVAADISTLFIMALGITFVIYIGSIDLSVQSIANMTTVLVTVLLPTLGFATIPAALLAGLLCGAASGFITTKWKVPSFISTLAIGGVALSIGQYVSGQRALFMDAGLRDSTFGWMIGQTFGLPNEILLALLLLILALLLERKTTFGRALKAIGAGEPAAVASGL